MKLATFLSSLLLFVGCVGTSAVLAAPSAPVAKPDNLDKAGCLKCHENKHEKIKVPVVIDGEEDERELRQIDTRKFGRSVHSGMQCVDCHKNIVDSQKNHKLDTCSSLFR